MLNKALNLINQRNENHIAPPPLTQQDRQNERSRDLWQDRNGAPTWEDNWAAAAKLNIALPPTQQLQGQAVCIQHNACGYPPNGMYGNARHGAFPVMKSWKLPECPRIDVWIHHCERLLGPRCRSMHGEPAVTCGNPNGSRRLQC